MENEIRKIWENAKKLFYYSKIEDTVEEEITKADIKIGLVVFFISAAFVSVISLVASIESFYLIEHSYESLKENNIEEIEVLSMDNVISLSLFYFLFCVPFFMLLSLVYEGLVYGAMKITGGKGTFAQQYYLSSIVALALATSTILILLVPLPCLNAMALFALLILSLYFTLFVNIKVYEIVHDITFLHSFVIVVILLIPRLLVTMLVINAVSMFFELPGLAIGV